MSITTNDIKFLIEIANESRDSVTVNSSRLCNHFDETTYAGYVASDDIPEEAIDHLLECNRCLSLYYKLLSNADSVSFGENDFNKLCFGVSKLISDSLESLDVILDTVDEIDLLSKALSEEWYRIVDSKPLAIKTPNGKSKIRPQTLNFSKADGYAVTDADMVIGKLKKDGRYKPDLWYRGFNGEKLKVLLKHGTDTPEFDTFFCCDEDDLRQEGINEDFCALSYVLNKPIPALSVYDGSKLTEGGHARRRFMDPENKLDALVAVYILKGFGPENVQNALWACK